MNKKGYLALYLHTRKNARGKTLQNDEYTTRNEEHGMHVACRQEHNNFSYDLFTMYYSRNGGWATLLPSIIAISER